MDTLSKDTKSLESRKMYDSQLDYSKSSSSQRMASSVSQLVHDSGHKSQVLDSQSLIDREAQRQSILNKRDFVNKQLSELKTGKDSLQQGGYVSGYTDQQTSYTSGGNLNESLSKTHHRKSVISLSADVSNAVLHRRGESTSTEAAHTISSTAADQKKSIHNLAETGQYISNSSQSSDRHSFTSLHRSQKEIAQHSSPDRMSKSMEKVTLQSESGNMTNKRMSKIHKQSNISHIKMSDNSFVSTSLYKREFGVKVQGPCPAALAQSNQAAFKHTKDSQKHKFYMPVVSSP